MKTAKLKETMGFDFTSVTERKEGRQKGGIGIKDYQRRQTELEQISEKGGSNMSTNIFPFLFE